MKIMRYNILVVFMLLTFAGCDNFLEQEPGSQTSMDELFSTYEGFEEALDGCYYDLEYAARYEAHTVYGDLLGGNLKFTPSSSDGEIDISSYVQNIYSFDDDAEESDLETFYTSCYDVINAANQILEHMDNLSDADESVKKQMIAECLTIRALSHFYILSMYAQNYTYSDDASHPGIICNSETQEVGVDYPARKTVKESYDFIIEDLETALADFSDENILEGPSYSYFNTYSCEALLARVCLFATEYEKAITYSSDVILNSGINLLGKKAYVSQWEESESPVSEIIFEFSATQNNEGTYTSGSNLSAFFSYTDESDYEDYCASQDLLDLYEEDDVRGASSMFISAELSTLNEDDELEDQTYYFTRKFQDNPGNPLLRMSEMYLIRAEAYVRTNEEESAVLDLNVIQDRAGATFTSVSDDVLEAVYTEKRKEFCFENMLFFDLARFHKDVERNDGCIASVCELSYPSDYFVLPIPEDNVELNSNLEQNEGY